MPDDEFDIESLAAYLHISAGQVVRLVDRGDLPGRRVSGSWRFSRSEIHQWLESRIGVGDDDELLKVEGVLGCGDDSSAEPWSLADLIPLAAIAIPLAANTRNSAIDEMIAVAARTGLLWDQKRLSAAVRAREDLHPTSLDNGVALLHPRRPLAGMLEQPFVALGLTDRPLPFGGSRGVLTNVLFLLCLTDERSHLRTLARISRLIQEPDFLPALRGSTDPTAVIELIRETEERLAS